MEQVIQIQLIQFVKLFILCFMELKIPKCDHADSFGSFYCTDGFLQAAQNVASFVP